jgi:hypothetical protein
MSNSSDGGKEVKSDAPPSSVKTDDKDKMELDSEELLKDLRSPGSASDGPGPYSRARNAARAKSLSSAEERKHSQVNQELDDDKPTDVDIDDDSGSDSLTIPSSDTNSSTTLMLPVVFQQALSRFKQDADKLAQQDEKRSSLPTAAQQSMMTLEQMASKFGGRELTESEQYNLLMSIAHLLSGFDSDLAQIASKALVTLVPAVYTQFASYGYKPTYIFAFVQKLHALHAEKKLQKERESMIAITCNACGTKVPDVHYHCEVCANFDLCHTCYEGNKHPEHKVMPRSCAAALSDVGSDASSASRSASPAAGTEARAGSSRSRTNAKRRREAPASSARKNNKKPKTKANSKSQVGGGDGSASKI